MKEQILEMVKPLLDKYEWELKETEKYIRLYKSRDYTSWENTYTRDFRLYIGKNLDSKNRIKIKIQERLIKYCDR